MQIHSNSDRKIKQGTIHWQFSPVIILLYPQHRRHLNESFLWWEASATVAVLGDRALHRTGLSKCKQQFAEQLASSP